MRQHASTIPPQRFFTLTPLLPSVLSMLVLLLAGMNQSLFQGVALADKPEKPDLKKEIWIPTNELPLLLRGRAEHMMMSRAAYDKLVNQAFQSMQSDANAYQRPQSHVLLTSSNYAVTVNGGVATIEAELHFDSRGEQSQLFPLYIRQAGLLEATLNGEPAQLVTPRFNPADQKAFLAENRHEYRHQIFLGIPGNRSDRSSEQKHVLKMRLLSPVITGTTTRALSFIAPKANDHSLSLKVPGDVELHTPQSQAHHPSSPESKDRSTVNILSRELKGSGDSLHTHFKLQPAATHMRLNNPIAFQGTSHQHHRTFSDYRIHAHQTRLIMSLNSRQARQDHMVLASHVLISELTRFTEKLHAKISLNVLKRPIKALTIDLPNHMVVDQVESAEIARWTVLDTTDKNDLAVKRLKIELRRPVQEPFIVSILASRKDQTFQIGDGVNELRWQQPFVRLHDITSQIGICGLLIEPRLQIQKLQADNTTSIDTDLLMNVLPESVLAGNKSNSPSEIWRHIEEPPLLPAAAFYTPGQAFEISASIRDRDDKLHLNQNTLLTFKRTGITYQGFAEIVRPNREVHAMVMKMPKAWRWEKVELDGKQLRRLEPEKMLADNPDEDWYRLTLPSPLKAGETARLRWTVAMRPSHFTEIIAQMPSTMEAEKPGEFAVPRVSLVPWNARIEPVEIRQNGSLVLHNDPDFLISPQSYSHYIPKKVSQLPVILRQKFGLAFEGLDYADQPHVFTYQHEDRKMDRNMTVMVSRKSPVISSRSTSFYKVEEKLIRNIHELSLTIERAGTDTIEVSLPESAGESIKVKGLGGTKIKGHRLVKDDPENAARDGWRRWIIELSQISRGLVNLQINYTRTLTRKEVKGKEAKVKEEKLSLWPPRIEKTTYQNAYVAVEGHKHIDVKVIAATKRVDIGELSLAHTKPGKHLIGVYHMTGDDPAEKKIQISISTPTFHVMPSTLVQEASLTTALSSYGDSLHAATYELRTVPHYLEIELPAGGTLWSILINGKPAKPQKQGKQLLVNLNTPGLNGDKRQLTILYQLQIPSIRFGRSLDLAAPALYLADQKSRDPVPVLNMQWQVKLPNELQLSSWDGSFEQIGYMPRKDSGLKTIAKAVRYSKLSPLTLDAYKSESEDSEAYQEQAPLNRAIPEASMSKMPVPAEATAPPPVAMKPQKANERLREDERYAGRKIATETKSIGEKSKADQSKGMSRLFEDKDLAGLASLLIHMESGTGLSQTLQFQSYGQSPALSLTVHRHRKISFINMTLLLLSFLFTFFGGARLLRLCQGKFKASESRECHYGWAVFIIIAATLLELLMTRTDHTGYLHSLMHGAAITLGLKIVFHLMDWFGPKRALSTACVALLCMFSVGMFSMDSMSGMSGMSGFGPQTLMANDKSPDPIDAPLDAIIVPFTPIEGKLPESKVTDELLIPYKHYQILWQILHPKLEQKPSPIEIALIDAEYKFSLEESFGSQSISAKGIISLDIPKDRQNTTLYMPLENAIINHAVIHEAGGSSAKEAGEQGTSANVRLVRLAPTIQRRQNKKTSGYPIPSTANLMAIDFKNSGQYKLSLSLSLPINRIGGWRKLDSVLPGAAAGRIQINVPKKETELRLEHMQQALVTTQDNQVHQTHLPRSGRTARLAPPAVDYIQYEQGRIALSWREKISEGFVDQTLKVKSKLLADIREDAVLLTGELSLDLGKKGYQQFSVQLSPDAKVEKVVGPNIQNWQHKKTARGSRLDINLLKEATGQETFRLHYREPARLNDNWRLIYPKLEGARLHQGEVYLRQSPTIRLAVKTQESCRRKNWPSKLSLAGKVLDENPLGLTPFQSFSFHSIPTLELSVREEVPEVEATFKTIVRLSPGEMHLETGLSLAIEHRPLYKVALAIPKGLEVGHLSAPDLLDWTRETTPEDGPDLLSVRFVKGQIGHIQLILTASDWLKHTQHSASIPTLQLARSGINVTKEKTYLAVQTDPAYELSIRDLVNGKMIKHPIIHEWLRHDQRSRLRAAVQFETDKADITYAGTWQLRRKSPRIGMRSITNIHTTQIAIEETVLLDLHIREAGIRHVSFTIPSRLKTAHLDAPHLSRMSLRPDESDPSLLLVTLHFQEALMGEVRIILRKDHPNTQKAFSVTTPELLNEKHFEYDKTHEHYLVLENTGSNEIITSDIKNLSALSREASIWHMVKKLLVYNTTVAYRKNEISKSATLSLTPRIREAVETIDARIGLAQTHLAMDGSGAYHAWVEYRVENRTEPYLSIALPDSAFLLSAIVDGEPIKPVPGKDSKGNPVLNIPLFKTETGDLDYPLVIKYGGKLKDRTNLGRRNRFDFPLAHTRNIQVERSILSLYLPNSHRWSGFDGTMRQTEDEGDIWANVMAHQNEQVMFLCATVDNEEQFSSLRALRNLSVLSLKAKRTLSNQYAYDNNNELQKQSAQLEQALTQAEKRMKTFENKKSRKADSYGNRKTLNDAWMSQREVFAENSLKDMNFNFNPEEKVAEKSEVQKGMMQSRSDLNKWIASNKLQENAPADPAVLGRGKDYKSKPNANMSKRRIQLVPQSQNMPIQGQFEQQGQSRGQGEGQGKQSFYGSFSKKLKKTENAQQLDALQSYTTRLENDITLNRRNANDDAFISGDQIEFGLSDRSRQISPGMVSSGSFVGGGGALEGGPGDYDASPRSVNSEKDKEIIQASQGWRSLDVNLPMRGQVFHFITTRGDIELSALATEKKAVKKISRFFYAVITMSVLLAIWLSRKRLLELTGLNRLSQISVKWRRILAYSLGFLLIITYVFALWGLALIGLLIASGIRRRILENRQPISSNQPYNM